MTGHRQAARRDYVYLTAAACERVIASGVQTGAVQLSLKRRGAVTRRSHKEVFSHTQDPEVGRALDFYYDTVATNDDGGEQLTYDLSVPANVTYLANGFVSHNTIGLVMDCDTTGVEPDFALVKFKKLAGGGYFKIINASIPPALTRLGYAPKQIEDIVRYCRGSGTLHGCPHVNFAALRAKGFPSSTMYCKPSSRNSPACLNCNSPLTGRWTVGDEVCIQQLGMTKEQLDAPGFDLLTALGFKRDQVNTANAYVTVAR